MWAWVYQLTAIHKETENKKRGVWERKIDLKLMAWPHLSLARNIDKHTSEILSKLSHKNQRGQKWFFFSEKCFINDRKVNWVLSRPKLSMRRSLSQCLIRKWLRRVNWFYFSKLFSKKNIEFFDIWNFSRKDPKGILIISHQQKKSILVKASSFKIYIACTVGLLLSNLLPKSDKKRGEKWFNCAPASDETVSLGVSKN